MRAQGSPCSHVSPCRFLAVRTEGSRRSRMVMEVCWTTWVGWEGRWPQPKWGCMGSVPWPEPFSRLLTPLVLSHAARSPPAAPTWLGSTVLAFGCPTDAVRAAQGRGGCWAHPCTALICSLTTTCVFSRCHQSWRPVAVILIPNSQPAEPEKLLRELRRSQRSPQVWLRDRVSKILLVDECKKPPSPCTVQQAPRFLSIPWSRQHMGEVSGPLWHWQMAVK